MDSNHSDPHSVILIDLFEDLTCEKAQEVTALPRSGSDRQYYRLTSKTGPLIGVYNPHFKENDAFITFSSVFNMHGVPVPEVHRISEDGLYYIQDDLGNETLLQRLQARRTGLEIPQDVLELYQKSLTHLAHMQTKGMEDFDYAEFCFPRAAFDKQSMMWDLNYFKYYFLKLAQVPFDEQALEDDFHTFSNYLLSTDTDHFMFRDFQARNIMLVDDKPYFIDFQGGRKGALQYDLASLLWQARAAIPQETRKALLAHYLDALSTHIEVERGKFEEYYYGYVLIRTIQVLGAYGFRGIFERKPHFLASIPHALRNLQWLLDNARPPVVLPELLRVLEALPQAEALQKYQRDWGENPSLTVRVQSFSYKAGLPEDPSGNGGGFVFDCRAIHNPGRYQPYKTQTGRDQPVKDFLVQNSRIETFIQDVLSIVEPSVERYIERGFSHLMVSFGCTGGRE
ncbi:MAG: RNase adapter RapZ, partial [Bacteroidota bacterium]